MTAKRGSSVFQVVLGGVWLLSSALAEAQTVATTTINVTVTVIGPTCVINNGRPIEVDFGNSVMTTRVDGKNYMKTVDYTLDCDSVGSNAMRMQIQGAASSNNGLSTNKSDLAIAFLNNGVPLPMNTWINFTWPNKPNLQAVPVRSGSQMLTGGEFSAAATMMVDYQ
ncbi:fimbrial protein [Pseudomonas carnis]|uniref:fimbrial protein n=1 Tax=Pseudomonas TaxID=286 RepID=UPI000F5637F0|nr:MULTISPECIES: fimbrial protein [Pseudomonas]AZC90138.1 Minor fimbrial subunit StfE [Pseudomonas chlororaphis subsp. piscium]MBY8955600.1 fimbrial protein [Pseudomonas carnis]